LQRLIETLLYPFRSSPGKNTASKALLLPAELLSVAVAENARGQGVGKRLVDVFEDLLLEWGYGTEYRVVTHEADPDSNSFYSSLGFRRAGSFRHHDHIMSAYIKDSRSSSEHVLAEDA